MSIGDHLSTDIKKKMYEKKKPIKVQREIDPEEIEERKFRETERMMGKFRDTYGRRKGGSIVRK